MIVIADSNLVISGLYAPNGVVTKIITTEKKIQFIAPDFIFEEINNHFEEILSKTGKNKRELRLLLKTLIHKILFFPVTEIPKEHINKAIEIVKDIDINDAFFVALYLYKKHKIWTSDKVLIKGLESKGYNICITTAELKTKLYKKS